MKKIMKSMKGMSESRQRKAVLRLELDYELATLFEAMGESNKGKMNECKEKLENIRKELLQLKAL
ncbi:hypothetical protein [Bacillus sp. B15-48]|uniref:hypothetical protein n=1 Tax=Bacillus sp. B15-48 TaxID=1548601 RepID=UPI00193F3594|nr:hypothetical protein [Bacillus sp. B15-48]MBM4764366.1 hypothetical protein [Bacillus sp. B15-48]